MITDEMCAECLEARIKADRLSATRHRAELDMVWEIAHRNYHLGIITGASMMSIAFSLLVIIKSFL